LGVNIQHSTPNAEVFPGAWLRAKLQPRAIQAKSMPRTRLRTSLRISEFGLLSDFAASDFGFHRGWSLLDVFPKEYKDYGRATGSEFPARLGEMIQNFHDFSTQWKFFVRSTRFNEDLTNEYL
jgi:hypothetical protein